MFIVKPLKTELEDLEEVIRKVIAGEIQRSDKTTLVKIAKSLEERGSEGIILGCTELPLIFPKKFSVPIFNSLEILARALLKEYYG